MTSEVIPANNAAGRLCGDMLIPDCGCVWSTRPEAQAQSTDVYCEKSFATSPMRRKSKGCGAKHVLKVRNAIGTRVRSEVFQNVAFSLKRFNLF
jgi:hypothetical protein